MIGSSVRLDFAASKTFCMANLFLNITDTSYYANILFLLNMSRAEDKIQIQSLWIEIESKSQPFK